MRYNLTQYSRTISNTAEGNISLSTDDIIAIISSGTLANISIPVSGTTSGTLVLDSDIGTRVHADEIQYYFNSTADMATVASGIKFYYKNEDFEVYISLITYYNANYYYAVLSDLINPRYIRVEHTVVSGTAGNVNGFYIINDDTFVDFGEDGTKTNHTVNVSLENDLATVDELAVFNSSPVKSSAKLIIEPQNLAVDSVLFLSDSADGPWQGVYNEADKITGAGLWESGDMDDLEVYGNYLKLSPDKTIGTYTTRILNLEEAQRLTFTILNRNYPAVLPSILFADDFTDGNDYNKWSEITNPGSIDFINARMEIRYDLTRVRTTAVLDYGHDWLFTCRIYFTDQSNLRIYINDTSGAYVYLQIDNAWAYSASNAMVFRTGGGYKYNPGNIYPVVQDQFYHKWNWIKVQKNFNTLRFKFWDTSEAEPDWFGSYTIPMSEVSATGRIDFRLIDDWANDRVYIDDVSLMIDYTAVVSENSFISIDSEDTTETMEVRSANSEPLPNETYIWMSGSYSAITKYTNYSWVEDAGLSEQSLDWGRWGQSGNFWEYWYDPIRGDEYIVDKPYYTGSGGDTEIYFRIRRKDGTLLSKTISDADYVYDCYYSTYKLSPDSTGGFWINYYLSRTGIGNGTYYLTYYDSAFVQQHSKTQPGSAGTMLYDFDTVYESNGDVWYTNRDDSIVFKLNRSGFTLASHLAIDDIRGVISLDDGGCWFIQARALIRLDNAGEIVDEIELPTTTGLYIYSDLHGGFWLQDGWYIRHLAADGTEYFNVYIENLYWITVMDSGVITKQYDGTAGVAPTASYISKYHKRVMRTWDYPTVETTLRGSFDYNRFGVRSHVYDDLENNRASGFPIAIDTAWDSALWSKVSFKDYTFSNDKYHQIRFKLRADNSANSPEVVGLWNQRAIEIPDIYPENYGKFYLKSDVSSLNAQDIGDYSSKIKAYWFVDTG